MVMTACSGGDESPQSAPAQELSDHVTITVGPDGTIKASALSFASLALTDKRGTPEGKPQLYQHKCCPESIHYRSKWPCSLLC